MQVLAHILKILVHTFQSLIISTWNRLRTRSVATDKISDYIQSSNSTWGSRPLQILHHCIISGVPIKNSILKKYGVGGSAGPNKKNADVYTAFRFLNVSWYIGEPVILNAILAPT